jgi:hypothetical protein
MEAQLAQYFKINKLNISVLAFKSTSIAAGRQQIVNLTDCNTQNIYA